MPEPQALVDADEIELACVRSGAGQTTEARAPGGAALASSDGAGAISDASGAPLLQARTAFAPNGKGGRLAVTDAQGRALGSAAITKFRFGPKALTATLLVSDPSGAELARFEPRDKKGQDVAIVAADGTPLGSLRQTGNDRGLRRSTTTYRLERAPGGAAQLRTLLLAIAMRHQALLVAARNNSDKR